MKNNDNEKMMAQCVCGALITGHHFISGFSDFADEIMVEDKLLSRICNSPEKHYRRYYIKDKRGKFRKIEEPDYYLALIQDRIRRSFLDRYPVSGFATAYHRGSKITYNAAPHVSRKYLLKMDLSDFFGHVTEDMVYRKVFSKAPFSRDIAKKLTKLCTLDRVLPQGASTSPALSNLVMTDFDEYMGHWCMRRGVSYTRYSDDLTFSSDEPLYPVFKRARYRLEKMGFEINEEKTHFITSRTRQQVTGIVVNEKINISSDYRRKLRQEIYYVLKYGAEDAYSRHKEKNETSTATARQYLLSLIGRTDHVLQVRKEDAYFREARRMLVMEVSKMDSPDKEPVRNLPFSPIDAFFHQRSR